MLTLCIRLFLESLIYNDISGTGWKRRPLFEYHLLEALAVQTTVSHYYCM